MNSYEYIEINIVSSLGEGANVGTETEVDLEKYEKALEEAKEQILKQQAYIEQITAAPRPYGLVVEVNEKGDKKKQTEPYVLLFQANSYLEVQYPKNLEKDVLKQLKAGVYVNLLPTGQIGSIVSNPESSYTGEIVKVSKVVSDKLVEIDSNQSSRLVYTGLVAEKLEEDQRIVVDSTYTICIKALDKAENKLAIDEKINVTWEDVGGQLKAKAALIEAVELPYQYKDLYEKYGKKPVKGILLYGPPGCGKTLMAKAVVTSLAKIHEMSDAVSSQAFIYIKGPEILSMWVGQTEARIRQIFEQARAFRRKHGFPATVFIDEADALLGKRGSGISSDVERTIVPQFLSEMDGMDENNPLLLLATNRSDTLDPAVVRDGRVDRKVYVGRPDEESAQSIFEIHAKNVPLMNGLALESFAKFGAEKLYDEDLVLYQIDKKKYGKKYFCLKDVVNGAMIEGIVDQASSEAIKREIIYPEKGKGVSCVELEEAIKSVYAQNQDLNHKEELADFVDSFRDDVKGIHKVKTRT